MYTMNSEHVYSTKNESQHNIIRQKLMLNWRHVDRYIVVDSSKKRKFMESEPGRHDQGTPCDFSNIKTKFINK